MTSTSGSADAGLLVHDVLVCCSVDLEVACFAFVSGKQTFPDGIPAVQGSLCCLVLWGLVIVGGKQTFPNGMATISSSRVPQSSRDFVRWFLVVRGEQSRGSCLLSGCAQSCFIQGGSIGAYEGFVSLALRACNCGCSRFRACM